MTTWSHRREAGFSMVETALAIGVIAFAGAAILGLLSLSSQGSQLSVADTLLSTMSKEIMSDLRGQHFVDATHLAGTTGVLAGTAAVPANGTITATVLNPIYFDDSGARLKDPTTNVDYPRASALANGAVYQCVPSVLPDAATLGATDASGNRAVNLVNVSLAFAWPATAVPAAPNPPLNPPNGRLVTSGIARY